VDVLLEEARRVDARAIVVGSHGNAGLERTVLGSVAEEVLARSWFPVLVVPGRTAEAGQEITEKKGKERPSWLS
jgi:nucleotide-binding universal stress UspA family protein